MQETVPNEIILNISNKLDTVIPKLPRDYTNFCKVETYQGLSDYLCVCVCVCGENNL